MDSWYLIVGLGNPGGRYSATRHNAGFMALDCLADRWSGNWVEEKKFNARVALVNIDDRRVVLCQPQTYMNLSGEAVGSLVRFYKIALDQLLIIVDDVSIPLGELRLRPQGGSGGHHGLESIELHVAGSGFARQRIGIGKPVRGDGGLTGHVLGTFGEAESNLIERVLKRSADQVCSWLSEGAQMAMNDFNGSVLPPAKKNRETEEKE